MDIEMIDELFEKHGKEYLEFKKIKNKLNHRPDLHAFLLLDSLSKKNDNSDMISYSAHDEFFLSVAPEDIKDVTEDQIIELIRCGVRISNEGGFCMFA